MGGDQISEFQIGSFRFLLQPFYVKAHSENFMMSLSVEDADAWWEHIERIRLKEKYPISWRSHPHCSRGDFACCI